MTMVFHLTLIKLVCGFLNPTEGRVLLDGRDISDYNRADVYFMLVADEGGKYYELWNAQAQYYTA